MGHSTVPQGLKGKDVPQGLWLRTAAVTIEPTPPLSVLWGMTKLFLMPSVIALDCIAFIVNWFLN